MDDENAERYKVIAEYSGNREKRVRIDGRRRRKSPNENADANDEEMQEDKKKSEG
jgi:hypothetical protein